MKYFVLFCTLLAASNLSAKEFVNLADLDLENAFCFRGQSAQKNRNGEGEKLSVGGQSFTQGVGTIAHSEIWVSLRGKVERFTAQVGVDDSESNPDAAVIFRVIADDSELFNSGIMKKGDAPQRIDVDTRERRHLLLLADFVEGSAPYNAMADWGDARFTLSGALPTVVSNPHLQGPKKVRTPRPGPAPRINGPAVYGCRPGRSFLHRIPAQGERPMKFSAKNLPATLSLDEETGIITGQSPLRKGDCTVVIQATNDAGTDIKSLRIVVGDELSLTPPMGWNHWYTWYLRITDRRIRNAADAMMKSGMADVGYSFVSMDDCWMRVDPKWQKKKRTPLTGLDPEKIVKEPRDPGGNILPNDNFPDMRALTDYIHQLGLKAGIYSSPGARTCQSYAGSLGHEWQDGRSYAEWGFDLLKYDWCSYGPYDPPEGESLDYYIKPFRRMGSVLKAMDRDLQFNICQYGLGEVWEWGSAVGGNSWRTGGDLGYTLESDGIYQIAAKNLKLGAFAGPGHWNDPDYLMLGVHGVPYRLHDGPIQTPLEPAEQYSYMSLWCMMASPLFFSGDMEQLDDFTVNVLCNPELIAVNQDELGIQATAIAMDDNTWILRKPMVDGSVVVGLFNLDEISRDVSVTWEQVNRFRPQRVRDLWRHKELGVFESEYTVRLPRKDVTVLRLWPAK